MAGMSGEPEVFAKQVADLLREIKPECEVELTGPRELLVNGRRLDLENVFRMVSTEPDRGSEIVRHYLGQLFATEAETVSGMTFEFARPRIMPRIQPLSIFEHLDEQMVAHVPFVNDTVVVFVIDMPHMTISVTAEQMVRWHLTADDLEQVARENLRRYTPELEFRMLESDEGGRAFVLSLQDGYDASRLLLDDLFLRMAPELGGDFLVATPSRDMFLAMSLDPEPFVNRVCRRVDEDYHRLPYPITNRLFYVTRDGVAGTELKAA